MTSQSVADTKLTMVSQSRKICHSAANFLRNISATITIEPMIFLHSIATAMIYLFVSSLTVFKLCRKTFGHSVEICRNLTSYPSFETEVQQVASDYNMYAILIETIPSLVFTIFLGPWSDRHGRKLPMVLPLITSILGILVYILVSEIEELPSLFLLLSPLLASLAGGMMTFTMAVSSYITDATDTTTRTTRIGIVIGFWYLGAPVGCLIGGFLKDQFGYTCVFGAGIAALVSCLLYTIFKVQETIKPPTEENPSKGCMKEFFSLQRLIEGFRTISKQRSDNKRLYLWLLTSCCCLLALTEDGSVLYLYARLKFDWDDRTYSYYIASALLVNCFAVVVVMPLLIKFCGITDPCMVILGLLSVIAANVVIAISTAGWMLFASRLILLRACTSPPLQSLLTQCVESDESGKLFSVLSMIQAALPILSGVLYSQMYKLTMLIFPGAVFLISCIMFSLALFIMIWFYVDRRKRLRNMNSNETGMETNKNEIAVETKNNETAMETKNNETAIETKNNETAMETKNNETAMETKTNETAKETKKNEIEMDTKKNGVARVQTG